MRKLSLLGMVCLSVVMSAGAAFGVARSIYDFKLKTLEGQPATLHAYKGKVVMLVNVASKCGYTPQYGALEALYKKYQAQGLVIVGIPANNFASQEPGTAVEIRSFCTRTYGVTFPMMSKVSVKGDDQAPLYHFLTDKSTDPQFAGDIQWNFTKFIFDRSGKPVARFEPAVKPDSPEVAAAIETALKQ